MTTQNLQIKDGTGALITVGTALTNTELRQTSLPVIDAQNLPIQGVINLTVGTTATAGRMLAINCTNGGNVSVTFTDTTTFVFPVIFGFQTLPFAVTQINTTGTTAVATYTNLK